MLCSSPGPLASQTLLGNTPIVGGGQVFDVAKVGNTVFLAGDFTYLGPLTGGAMVILDGATGAVEESFLAGGGLTAIADDGAGGWYVGRYGYLAHVLPGGTVDPNWVATVSAAPMSGRGAFVRSILVHGSTVFIAGQFDSLNGQPRPVLGAVDATTGALLPSFNISAVFTGTWTVNAMAINGTTLFVGGEFSSIGGQPRQNLAALDLATGNALPWIANTDGPVSNKQVRSLLVDGSNLYVGGEFLSLGGFPRNRLARVDVSTAAMSPWNPNADGIVRALAMQAGTLYVGGSFTAVGGAFRNRLAALSTVTNSATGWNPNLDNAVSSMTLIGGTLYAGGDFKNVGSQVRWGVAAIDLGSGLATAWKANTNFAALVHPHGSDVLASGGNSFGGEPRSFLAAFDATTGAVLPWNPGPNQPLFCMATDGTTLYLGGTFTTVGGQNRTYLASVSVTTGAVNPWSPSAGGVSFPYPHDLELSGTTLYVGGEFTTISGTSRPHLAAFDTATGNLTSWNPAADGVVETIFPHGGLVYVGGSFTSVGGAPRVALAALDPAGTGSATEWNPGPNQGPVKGIATDGSRLYVSGAFTSIGGYFRRYLAAVDLSTGFATEFDPNPTHVPSNIAVHWSNLYAAFGAGNVTIGGQTRKGLAELTLPAGAVSTWVPPILSSVTVNERARNAIVFDGWSLYLGGAFSVADPTWGAVGLEVVAFDFSHLVGVDGSPVFGQEVEFGVTPNPASGPVRMWLNLPRDADVRARVFDLQGREIATLADRRFPAGMHEIGWDGASRSGHRVTGIAFVRVEALGQVRVRRLALLR